MKLLNHVLNVEERFNLVSFGLVSVVMLCDYKVRCLRFKGFGLPQHNNPIVWVVLFYRFFSFLLNQALVIVRFSGF